MDKGQIDKLGIERAFYATVYAAAKNRNVEKLFQYLFNGDMSSIVDRWIGFVDVCKLVLEKPLPLDIKNNIKPRKEKTAHKTVATREQAEIYLRQLAAKNDGVISTNVIKKGKGRLKKYSYHGLSQIFGSIKEMRKASDARSSFKTNDEVLQKLADFAKKLGRKPTMRDTEQAARKRECPSPTALDTRFGTFANALELAGIK